MVDLHSILQVVNNVDFSKEYHSDVTLGLQRLTDVPYDELAVFVEVKDPSLAVLRNIGEFVVRKHYPNTNKNLMASMVQKQDDVRSYIVEHFPMVIDFFDLNVKETYAVGLYQALNPSAKPVELDVSELLKIVSP